MTDTNNAQTETSTTATEAPKVKRIRRPSATTPSKATVTKPKATKTATKPIKAAKPVAAPKAPKPPAPKYAFSTGYAGPSDALNSRASRTPIDLSRFGQFTGSVMTERDETAVKALRKQFGEKPFARQNLDAGIIRRLGERGCIVHVSGANNASDAMFRLTNKGLGKADAPKRTRKAA